MTSDAQFVCGTLTVQIGAAQWGFVDSYQFLERSLGETPYFSLHRQLYGITLWTHVARFVRIESIMENLRNLGIESALTARPVTFTPNLSGLPGDFYLVDWPDQQSTRWVIENRDEMILRLAQQSPGA